MDKIAKIVKNRIFNKVEPQSIDESMLYLSWNYEGGCLRKQTAYRIVVSSREDSVFSNPDLWDSGKVASDSSSWIQYEGSKLSSRQKCYWSVMAWDENDKETRWSSVSNWRMGLLETEDWEAGWISYKDSSLPEFDKSKPYFVGDDYKKGTNELYLPPFPLFRKEFSADKKIKEATAYISALGIYELSINGAKVGDYYFTPGWTEYDKRVYYEAYDVTQLLQSGKNVCGIILSDGWYAGYVGLVSRNQWGDTAKVLMQIEIEYEDGGTKKICTDESWQAQYGPFEEADLYQGERYNAAKEIKDWNRPECTYKDWKKADVCKTESASKLYAHIGAYNKEYDTIQAVSFSERENGEVIIDFGLNFTGVVRLTGINETQGTEIKLDYAEVLGTDGDLNKDSYRSARNTDYYICAGGKEESYQPRFAFRAFRYVKISGLSCFDIKQAEGIFISSDIEDNGKFETSEPVINDIYNMLRHTMRCAYLEVPMDCCGRDERLGWGYDPCFSFRSSTYLFDSFNFAVKWYTDIADVQRENGSFNPVAPAIKMDDVEMFDGDAHADSGMQMPWTIYKMYGFRPVFERHYGQMKKYFSYLEKNNDRAIRIFLNSDWLSILDNGHTDYVHGWSDVSRELIGTAMFAYNARIMSNAAKALGKDEDYEYYTQWYEKIKKAFQRFFELRDGSMRAFAQGDMAVALYFDMLSEQVRENTAKRLCKDIESNNHSLTTGVTSTTFVFDALSENGCHEEAVNILLSEDYPGYKYMLDNGATSCWERWDSYHHEDGPHPHPMNGYNHIGLSCMTAWFYRKMAGIEQIEPGFKKFRIKPYFDGKADHVSAEYMSQSGLIKVDWKKTKESLSVSVTVPANTQAQIHVPDTECIGGTLPAETDYYVEKNRRVYKLECGEYTIINKV